MALRNFSYLIEGKIAGSELPGFKGDLKADLRFLRQQGIRAIVTAREAPLDELTVREHGFEYLFLPVADFTPPTIEQFEAFRRFVAEQTANGDGAVVVHCRAGIGRTGTLLASWLVAGGMDVDEAITNLRMRRPGSVESPSQYMALADWREHLRQSERGTEAEAP